MGLCRALLRSATRYNYTEEEKFVLIKVIAVIKGLQVLMSRMETFFTEAIRRNIYAQLQDLVQVILREPLRKAIKNKRDLIRSAQQILLSEWIHYNTSINAIPLYGSTFCFISESLQQCCDLSQLWYREFYLEMTMERRFVGPCHMRHMCRLLGYQGIAVVMEELLQIVKLLIQGNLLQFTKTLMEAMPKTCKLPRYDYGSPGFFKGPRLIAQFNDIVQYPDARTELFHNFHEFGNTILLCLLMEQALVRNVRSSPCYRIPEHLAKATLSEKPEVKLRKLEAKFDSLYVVAHVEKLGSARQTMIAKEGDLLTRERLCCGLSLFKNVLSRLRGLLDDPTWVGVPPTNGVMNIDERTEFHRLWSALQFVHIIPVGETEFTVQELFVEGLNWAGCSMIVLPGQQCRFEALDFCYHILRVQKVDGKDQNIKGINLKRMVDQIHRFQVLNS
ncbi:unnamed protein product [Bemisia tabaci]|uniref:Cytoplasmic FMR1-interacting protein n=1 Tax=Bemisia tabaci TaxID=7038 RepID=A0A9P0AEG9_BEMTA|nr:unnamed protein product [Bemisia tabaci]